MHRSLLLVLAVLLLASCSQAVRKLTVAVDPHWPPMEFLDEAGQPAGYDVDLVRALGGAGGFEVEFRQVGWDRLLEGLEKGEYDAVASSVVVDEAKATKYDFSAPYLNAGQVLVVPASAKTRGLTELRGQPVGAQLGTAGAAVAQSAGAAVRTYPVLDQAFADLAAGRISAVVAGTPMAALATLRTARYRDAFKVVGQTLTDESYALVVRKGNRRVLEALDGALLTVKEAGALADLAGRWLR